MKTIKIGKHQVMFYSSIKEMPARRYNTLQLALMEDSGIGSSMKDVDEHFHQLDVYLSAGKIQDAIIERQNLHMALYAMINGINTQSKSLSLFIYSIDGKQVSMLDENIAQVMSKLDQLSIGEVGEILTELKKNCISN